MEDKNNISNDLVHLSRLALSGRRQDILLYIRKLSKRFRKELPDIAEQLDKLISENPTLQKPFRSTDISSVPVDIDSRLQLARHEYPVQLEIEPIWNQSISDSLDQVIKEREEHDKLLKANLLPTRSILLTGPPGVGKSLTARWLAKKLDKPLVILDLSAVMSSFLGRTGNNLRNVIDYAKSVDCILFLDEFDSIAKRRDDATEIGELKRLVTVLLQEIDDLPATGLLLAATNHSKLLDPAVWRRFDLNIEFSLPSNEQIRNQLHQLIGDEYSLNKNKDIFELFPLALKGFSYSEIERLVMQAKKEALIREVDLLTKLLELTKGFISILEKEKRFDVALKLVDAGISQRKTNEITGVSRDTIRKLLNQEVINE